MTQTPFPTLPRVKVATVVRRGTFYEVLDGFPHSSVEGSSVSRALKSEPELSVVDFPVVEGGVCLCVHEVLLHKALQHHLGGREPQKRSKVTFPTPRTQLAPSQPRPKSKPSHASRRGTSFPTKRWLINTRHCNYSRNHCTFIFCLCFE